MARSGEISSRWPVMSMLQYWVRDRRVAVAAPLVMLLVLLNFGASQATGSSPSPAVFVFGDSIVDPGNNNDMKTLAKANYPPYGSQFDNQVRNGRFTNGRIVSDYLAALLGLPLVPGFNDPQAKGANLLHGVNFGSAGGGVLDSTGSLFGGLYTLSEQLGLFRDYTQPAIYSLLGKQAGDEFFRNSMYFLSTGSNDYINGYYFFVQTTPPGLSIDQLTQLVVATYSQHLKSLYNLGARKVAVTGLGALGCIPSQIARYNISSGTCIKFLNDACINYNSALKTMLSSLRVELPDFHLVYSDTYELIFQGFQNPTRFGLTNSKRPCCGYPKFNFVIGCFPYENTCNNPDEFLFFDYYHPTDKMNKEIAEILYSNGPPYNDPYSIRDLSAIHI